VTKLYSIDDRTRETYLIDHAKWDVRPLLTGCVIMRLLQIRFYFIRVKRFAYTTTNKISYVS